MHQLDREDRWLILRLQKILTLCSEVWNSWGRMLVPGLGTFLRAGSKRSTHYYTPNEWLDKWVVVVVPQNAWIRNCLTIYKQWPNMCF